MPRLPCTISLMRRGGTLIALASAYWLIPRGLRTLPKEFHPDEQVLICAYLAPKKVINDLNVEGISIFPAETHLPLSINTDAVLPDSIPLEQFQPIVGGILRSSIRLAHSSCASLRSATRSILTNRAVRLRWNRDWVSGHLND